MGSTNSNFHWISLSSLFISSFVCVAEIAYRYKAEFGTEMKLDVGLLVLLIRFLSLSSPCQGETGNCEYNNSCTNKDIGANGVSFVLPNQSNLDEIETKCPNAKSSGVLLSRRRRSLSFPDGSNFVASILSLKNTQTGPRWLIARRKIKTLNLINVVSNRLQSRSSKLC